jgi:hypothetical protein
MSKIALTPNASGTGTFTIASPNSNTDRTLTLPDEAGTVLTDVSDLPAANLTGDVAAARIADALNASGSAPIYACRAWVNWDGNSGSGNTIRASGNVSSVSRTATGEFTVNFSTAMPDANYCVQLSTGVVGAGFGVGVITSQSTSAMSFVQNRLDVPGRANSSTQCVAIFR